MVEEGSLPLDSAGCVFNARFQEAKKASVLMNNVYADDKYSRVLLAGCGEFKSQVYEMLLPKIQNKVDLVSVAYTGEDGWNEAINRMQETIAMGYLHEQATAASEFITSAFHESNDRWCTMGLQQTLFAVEQDLVGEVLLADPVPPIPPTVTLPGVTDLEDYVVNLCENHGVELTRITAFNDITNMFVQLGGIGGYLHYYVPPEQLDPEYYSALDTLDPVTLPAMDDNNITTHALAFEDEEALVVPQVEEPMVEDDDPWLVAPKRKPRKTKAAERVCLLFDRKESVHDCGFSWTRSVLN